MNDDPSILAATAIEVLQRRRPLLDRTTLSLQTGETLVAVGEPGHGHTATRRWRSRSPGGWCPTTAWSPSTTTRTPAGCRPPSRSSTCRA